MSFIQRAREAAEAAASKAHEAAAMASRTAHDPTTVEKLNKSLNSAGQGAKEAAGFARKSMNTIIERIDPSTLAELIIKATALQEQTNKSLRTKGSPYRISEISIAATIPPGVTFAIGRIDDEPEALGEVVVSSAELLESGPDTSELVLSLDGTTVDEAVLSAGTPAGSEGTAAVGDAPAGEAAPAVLSPSAIETEDV